MSSEKKNGLWTEDVIQQKVTESAEDIPIPESLEPEQIKKRLQEKQIKGRVTLIRRITEIAAAAVLVVAIGGIGVSYRGQRAYESGDSRDSMGAAQENFPGELAEGEGGTKNRHSYSAGNKYVLAKSYEDIYDVVVFDYKYINEAVDLAENEGAANIVTGLPEQSLETADGQGAEGGREPAADSGTDYNKTNLQTEGVDESDVVKTDGSYFYVAAGGQVRIVRIDSGKMEEVGHIRPDLESGDSVREMYVDGNRLYLISETQETALKLEENESFWWNSYYMDTDTYTQLRTYDITDRSNPSQLGTVTQEGYYNTSRKVGNYIYMFTDRGIDYYETMEEFLDNAIPRVQGEKLTASDIYIPNRASSQLIVASVDVEQPDKVVDRIAVFNDNTRIYVGSSSIYLYNSSWDNEGEYTEIARFSYKDGYMDAKAAASVKGTIRDTFAINEKDGCLRVLTSGWGTGDVTNRLFLLDESLKLTGEIDDIAQGETIYAARYLGDMAYFITYRNTDPLFVADLSEASNPRLLGSVEVTGFSDYLHFYGENLLLGIGYETDEDSVREGVKLCMFDIADGANPKVIGTKVIEKAAYTAAADDYKCVLASPEKNLIGFLAEDPGAYREYKVFQWQENGFVEVLSQPLKKEMQMQNSYKIRGIYVGEYFYIVGDKEIRSYDMKDGFSDVEKLTFEK